MKVASLIVLGAAVLLPPSGARAQPPPAYPLAGAMDEPLFYFERKSVKTLPVSESNWREIKAYLTKSPPTWVRITTHSDSAGPPDYNMVLSVRRGEAAARRVAAMGVDPAIITIVACGEYRLAVATGDGVDEPLNRRGVIEWGDDRPPDIRLDEPCKVFAYEPGK